MLFNAATNPKDHLIQPSKTHVLLPYGLLVVVCAHHADLTLSQPNCKEASLGCPKTTPQGATEVEAGDSGSAHSVQVCEECGEKITHSRLYRMENAVANGTESNVYVQEFVELDAPQKLREMPWCHRALNNKKLKKEVTETWGILKAIDDIVRRMLFAKSG